MDGDNDGAGGGRKLRCDEGRRKADAHLREGACRELQFLLKQGAQHLVLSFEVKHSFLQLDALLPKVLHHQEEEEEKKETIPGRGDECTVLFIRAVGTPPGPALLLHPPLGGRLQLSNPQ